MTFNLVFNNNKDFECCILFLKLVTHQRPRNTKFYAGVKIDVNLFGNPCNIARCYACYMYFGFTTNNITVVRLALNFTALFKTHACYTTPQHIRHQLLMTIPVENNIHTKPFIKYWDNWHKHKQKYHKKYFW